MSPLISLDHTYLHSNLVGLTIVAQENTPAGPVVIGEQLMFYNGTEAQFNTVFAEFLTIPSLSTSLGPLSYIDMTNILPPGNERTNAVST